MGLCSERWECYERIHKGRACQKLSSPPPPSCLQVEGVWLCSEGACLCGRPSPAHAVCLSAMPGGRNVWEARPLFLPAKVCSLPAHLALPFLPFCPCEIVCPAWRVCILPAFHLFTSACLSTKSARCHEVQGLPRREGRLPAWAPHAKLQENAWGWRTVQNQMSMEWRDEFFFSPNLVNGDREREVGERVTCESLPRPTHLGREREREPPFTPPFLRPPRPMVTQLEGEAFPAPPSRT